MDSMLNMKRAAVWGLSFLVGLIASLAIVYGPMGTDIGTFSYKYFVLMWIPFSMIFLIWGDALLGTHILVD
jgi:hypothetical protein